MSSYVVREDTKALLTCSVSSRLSSVVRGDTASPSQDAASAVSPPTCFCQPQTGTYCDGAGSLVHAATANSDKNIVETAVFNLQLHWGYSRKETLLALLNQPWGLL